MGRSRYKVFDTAYPHFLTCTVIGWLPVFTRPETTQIVFDSWRFLQDQSGFEVYGYVILENHLHLIAYSEDLAKDVARFKSFTARRIIDYLEACKVDVLLDWLRFRKARHKTDREYQLWQEGAHPQAIQNAEMMVQKLEYAHLNPVKRGYVDDPTHWRWSSAWDYAGGAGLIPVVTDWH